MISSLFIFNKSFPYNLISVIPDKWKSPFKYFISVRWLRLLDELSNMFKILRTPSISSCPVISCKGKRLDVRFREVEWGNSKTTGE